MFAGDCSGVQLFFCLLMFVFGMFGENRIYCGCIVFNTVSGWDVDRARAG